MTTPIWVDTPPCRDSSGVVVAVVVPVAVAVVLIRVTVVCSKNPDAGCLCCLTLSFIFVFVHDRRELRKVYSPTAWRKTDCLDFFR